MKYSLLICGSLLFSAAFALNVNFDDKESIKNGIKFIAINLISYYNNSTPTGGASGLFSSISRQSSGTVWDSFIDYWFLIGDTQYNGVVEQALRFQLGPNNDFLPTNKTNLGSNYEQTTWGSAALTAAERRFPSSTVQPSWLDIAVNVFNSQVARWDTQSCGGGLRQQITPTIDGYDYKDGLSNALFFLHAARLYRLTGNKTYGDWAIKTWDWMEATQLYTNGYAYEGASTTNNCSTVDKVSYTATIGFSTHGGALLSAMTGEKRWFDIIATITIQAQGLFFENGIEVEASCEKSNNCTTDQYFYKGLLSRDGTRGTLLVANGAYANQGYMKTSAVAAVATCSQTGADCALIWTPGNQGSIISPIGAEYSTLQVLQANIAGFLAPPVILHPPSSSSSIGVNLVTMMICLGGFLLVTW